MVPRLLVFRAEMRAIYARFAEADRLDSVRVTSKCAKRLAGIDIYDARLAVSATRDDKVTLVMEAKGHNGTDMEIMSY